MKSRMTNRAALVCLVASLFGCEARPVVTTAVRCAPCQITLHRVGAFSDSAEPGVLPNTMVFAVLDSSGRLFTTSRKKDAVLVFGADGALLGRLGRVGDGPGEFRMVRRILIGPGDSIYISDWSLRVHVFAPTLMFVRTQLVPHPPSLVLADGSFVVAEQIGTADKIGYPVHHIHADGRFGKSFGADTPQYRPDLKLITNRFVAIADSGNAWTIAPGRYTIERWNPSTGQRTFRIDVRSDWFTEVAKWPMDENVRPPAVVETLWEDEGVLWVLFRVADQNWSAPRNANEERAIDADEYNQTYDWIVEAVDPQSGLVLASRRFDSVLWGRSPSTVLVSEVDTDILSSKFEVWRPTLHQGVNR